MTHRSTEAKSQKSELTFYVSDRKQIFKLIENIGNNYRNENFENIFNYLRRADSVSVWIKKSELQILEPKIFQINVDNKTLLPFEKVRTEKRGVFLITLFMGLSILIFSFLQFYPEKSRQLFRTIWPEK